jgi:hypothetical protein
MSVRAQQLYETADSQIAVLAVRLSKIDLDALLARLESARRALVAIKQLGEEQLDSVPPAGEMRFADGQRTLEQVVASLLEHQRHQVDSIAAALT